MRDFKVRADDDQKTWLISQLQASSATRLLYYFPRQSTAMITDRLDRLQVADPPRPAYQDEKALTPAQLAKYEAEVAEYSKAVTELRLHNGGLYVPEFVSAVAWFDAPEIRDALFGVFQRTDDFEILKAALPNAIKTHPDVVLRQIQTIIATLVEMVALSTYDSLNSWTCLTRMVAQLGAIENRGDREGYEYYEERLVLRDLADAFGPRAKPAFARFLKDGEPKRYYAVGNIVAEDHLSWALDLFVPALTDSRSILGETEPMNPGINSIRIHVRVRDEAALTIHALRQDLPYSLADSPADRDKEIEATRAKLGSNAK